MGYTNLQQKRLDEGLCFQCGGQPQAGRWMCRICADRINSRRREQRASRYAAGMCSDCGKNKAEAERRFCAACIAGAREKYAQSGDRGREIRRLSNQRSRLRNPDKHREKNRRHIKETKQKIIAAYGGKCACCDEMTPEFLTIDHVNNDGADHRREISGCSDGRVPAGYHFYRWLLRREHDPRFQVLCYNCNVGKHINGGICPHRNLRLPDKSSA